MKKSPSSHPFRYSLRVILLLAIVALSLGSHGTSRVRAVGLPPANDNFVNATPITLPFNPGALDTTGASQQAADPELTLDLGGCEGIPLRQGRGSVWYSFNPGGTSLPVFLDTSGSTTSTINPNDPPDCGINGNPACTKVFEYDTYIAVFTGSSLDTLKPLVCNDSPNNSTNQAQASFYAVAGTTYYIEVAQYMGRLDRTFVEPGYQGGSLVFKASTGLTISGNVGNSGLGLKGVAVTSVGGKAITDQNGNYTLAIPSAFTDTVNVSLFGTVFTPPSTNYVNVNSSLTNQNYTAKRFNDVSRWTQSFDLSHGWTVAQYVRTVGDVDGDGRDDAVGFGLDGIYGATANTAGTGFNVIAKWSDSLAQANGWTVKDYVRTVGDVNGDGKADAVGFGIDGVYVALALNTPAPLTGFRFGTVSKWSDDFNLNKGWTVAQYVRLVGDVTGDGKDDLVGYGLDGIYVAKSNGTSFDPITKWSSSLSSLNGWNVTDYARTLADVNGDGKADAVGFGLDGVYVAISNGTNAFNTVTKWSSDFNLNKGWTVAGYVRTLGDVNGDGKDDVVGFGLDGVYVGLSDGVSAFKPIVKWSGILSAANGWTVQDYVRTTGDINGDGLDDLVGFGLDGVYIGK